jgi:hypothetical protein
MAVVRVKKMGRDGFMLPALLLSTNGDFVAGEGVTLSTEKIMSTLKKYKWNSPHEWLFEHAELWPAETLLRALHDLASCCDSDTIQDVFQSEMDADGYFKLIGERNDDA